MPLAIAMAAAAGGCLQRGVPCDERYCPNGYICIKNIEGGFRCHSSDLPCGDGTIDTDLGEVCDDGNMEGGDGCSANCRSKEPCGDGIIDKGEVCDDANSVGGDGCSADCRSNEVCGNGVPDSGEACDCGTGDVPPTGQPCAGRQNSADGGYCRDDCQVHCGDGRLAPEEVCDPAYAADLSCARLRYDFGRPGCSGSCDSLLASSCGDWNWRAHESETSTSLTGVWGSGPGDVFAVGKDGVIVHYDGLKWTSQPSNAYGSLHGVWGSGPSDVFAVGDGGTVERQ
ncbi:hypothetical protein [Sorangium sp. So ce341]|uniref:hypothetical protein n=1 Tax=Sorangium sp. So ce341 TaxID=3133302 RepID=UPI003F612901